MKAVEKVATTFAFELLDDMLDEVATEEADKVVIAKNPGIVKVVNTVHAEAALWFLDEVLEEEAEEKVVEKKIEIEKKRIE